MNPRHQIAVLCVLGLFVSGPAVTMCLAQKVDKGASAGGGGGGKARQEGQGIARPKFGIKGYLQQFAEAQQAAYQAAVEQAAAEEQARLKKKADGIERNRERREAELEKAKAFVAAQKAKREGQKASGATKSDEVKTEKPADEGNDVKEADPKGKAVKPDLKSKTAADLPAKGTTNDGAEKATKATDSSAKVISGKGAPAKDAPAKDAPAQDAPAIKPKK